MTKKQVADACYIRGIYFDGEKKFRNTMVGSAYSVNLPDGGFCFSETLDSLYKVIKNYPVIRRNS